MASETKENERFLTLPEVISTCGLGKSAIYALIAKGLFPKQIKLMTRKSVWPSSQIQKWILDRMVPT